jgi:hypothetical protein
MKESAFAGAASKGHVVPQGQRHGSEHFFQGPRLQCRPWGGARSRLLQRSLPSGVQKSNHKSSFRSDQK